MIQLHVTYSLSIECVTIIPVYRPKVNPFRIPQDEHRFPRKKYFRNSKKILDFFELRAIIQKLSDNIATKYGGIAQLGERLNGIQEVSGSIPLISTRKS